MSDRQPAARSASVRGAGAVAASRTEPVAAHSVPRTTSPRNCGSLCEAWLGEVAAPYVAEGRVEDASLAVAAGEDHGLVRARPAGLGVGVGGGEHAPFDAVDVDEPVVELVGVLEDRRQGARHGVIAVGDLHVEGVEAAVPGAPAPEVTHEALVLGPAHP